MSSPLVGGKGKLTTLAERQQYCQWIADATLNGARQSKACELVGLSRRTYQRWNEGDDIREDQRLYHTAPVHNRLPDTLRQEILSVINQPEHQMMTPHQIVPALLDKGDYFASESSIYRIMRENKQLSHRGKMKIGKQLKPTPLQATGPNQVYSWDITYLMTPIKGLYYYLYLVLDIFSRKIVGWQVHDVENSVYAADLMQDICNRELIKPDQLVLHSDNGGPMKGATLRAKVDELGIDLSYSRPRVSNDNPFSESMFKTVKYHPTFPEAPFDSLSQAREWVAIFVHWYNHEHRHSGIKFVTPHQRHEGLDSAILANRKTVIENAKKAHPQRWNNRETRNLQPITVVSLNPGKTKTA